MSAYIMILGEVGATRDGRAVELPRGRTRALLAVLACERSQGVSDPDAIERVWAGRAPTTAVASLRNQVVRLRSLLGAASIDRTTVGYRLTGECELDVDRFDDLVATARRHHAVGDADAAIGALDGALALVRGTPLGELADEAWAASTVTALTERILLAEELWAEVRLRGRRATREIDRLRAAADAAPHREIRWRQVIEAYEQAGRRTEALRAAAQARRALAEFGLVPGAELLALERQILDPDGPAGLPDTVAVNLRRNDVSLRGAPSYDTPLVGREADIERGWRLVRRSRLVTVTGTGGVGKTRYAVELGGVLGPRFPRGVFVDLAVVRSEAQVPQAIADAIGLVDGESTADIAERVVLAVGTEPTLLVLDNAEHVVGGVADLAETLVAGDRDVAVLVTSRLPLGTPAESVLHLGPLAVPAVDDPEAAESPAVVLLAQLAPSGAATGSAAIAALARIARRLDGLPLALELVARLLVGSSPTDVADELARLGSRLLPADERRVGRHRSLDDLFAWTIQQLTPDERAVLARLSVLAGDATLATAERLADLGDLGRPVLSILARLVELDLVQPGRRGELSTFRLRPIQREYAERHLDDRGETARVRERQVAWYLELASRDGLACRGPGQAAAVARLDAEWDNLRSVLDELRSSGRWDEAADMASPLAPFWFISGRWSEGPAICRRLLDDPEAVDPIRRSRLVVAIAESIGTYAGVASLVEDLEVAARVLEDAGDHVPLATAHVYAATGHMWRGSGRDFRRHLEAAEQVAVAHEVPWVHAAIPQLRGLAAGSKGDVLAARSDLHESKRRRLALGDRARAAYVLLNLGMFLQRHADPTLAEAELEECLRLADGLSMRSLESHVAYALAQIAAERGDETAEDRLLAVRAAMHRQGDVGCAHGCNRVIASILRRRGDDDAALRTLRQSLEAVARVDQQELAMSIVEIAEIYCGRGRADDAAVLAAAAHDLAARSGIGLNGEQRRRLELLAATVGRRAPSPVPVEVALAVAMA